MKNLFFAILGITICISCSKKTSDPNPNLTCDVNQLNHDGILYDVTLSNHRIIKLDMVDKRGNGPALSESLIVFNYDLSGNIISRYTIDSLNRVERVDTLVYSGNQLLKIVETTFRDYLGVVTPAKITRVSNYSYSAGKLTSIRDSSVSTTGGATRLQVNNYTYDGDYINTQTTYEYLNGIYNRSLKDSVVYSTTENSLKNIFSIPSFGLMLDDFFVNQPKLVQTLYSYEFDNTGVQIYSDEYNQNEIYSLENGYVKTLRRNMDVYYTLDYDCH